MSEVLRLERRDGVALLILDRPKRLNAIGSDTHVQLQSALDTIEADPALRAVVITGAGSVFSAGADISEMRTIAGTEGFEAFIRGFHACHSRLSALRQPSIAAINGLAFGGGFELALACDFRVAARTAKLGLPEIKLGLLPGAGGTQRLTRLVPMNIAQELIIAGKTLDAERAYALGLVNSVVEPGDVLAEALQLGRELAAGPPRAMALGKRLLHEGLELDLAAALELEIEAACTVFGAAEAKEGLAAFAAKRPPHWAA